ncbi:hypothetical protein HS125_08605 [bacterium]|nr:hypothetical protein [bacterium]
MDISEQVKPGDNEVSVLVYGSLKNLLGPHHAGKVRGSAWPNMFQRAPESGQPPGSAYDVLAYGLMEDFNLLAP